MNDRIDPSQNTRDWIDLKINSLKELVDSNNKALRAEIRALFVLAVVSNTVLQHISLSPTVAWIGRAGLAGVAGLIGLKVFLLR